MQTMAQALNQALFDSMKADEQVVLIGEDVGTLGGVFRVSDQLIAHFGPKRVLDMPLSEALIAGSAIGMAIAGLKVVCEFQFMGFSYPGLDQIINHAARMRYRTCGQKTCPVVYRMPFGGGNGAPEHHSESTEALFAHIPGLTVVTPSSATKAYHFLKQAIASDDPVIFLEPKKLYHRPCTAQDDSTHSMLAADVVKRGNDVTVITYGSLVHEVVKAAESLQDFDIQVEVIDLCSLKPIDWPTVMTSIEKTHRCVLVHEAAPFASIASTVVDYIQLHAHHHLEAPILTVSPEDVPLPYYRDEAAYRPCVEKIIEGIESVLEYDHARF